MPEKLEEGKTVTSLKVNVTRVTVHINYHFAYNPTFSSIFPHLLQINPGKVIVRIRYLAMRIES